MTTPPLWRIFMQRFFEAPESPFSFLLLYNSLTGRCGSSPTSNPGLSFHFSSLQGWLMQYPLIVGYLHNRQSSLRGEQQDGSKPKSLKSTVSSFPSGNSSSLPGPVAWEHPATPSGRQSPCTLHISPILLDTDEEELICWEYATRGRRCQSPFHGRSPNLYTQVSYWCSHLPLLGLDRKLLPQPQLGKCSCSHAWWHSLRLSFLSWSSL